MFARWGSDEHRTSVNSKIMDGRLKSQIRFGTADEFQTSNRGGKNLRSSFTAGDVFIGTFGITITANPVAFDLRIQGCVLDAQEAGSAGLIASGLFQSCANQVSFKSLHFVLKPDVVVAGWLSTSKRVDRAQQRQRHFFQGVEAAVYSRFTQQHGTLSGPRR